MTVFKQTLILFFIAIVSLVGFGCSSAQESAGEELKLDDGYKVNESNEIMIDDSAFNDKNIPVSTLGERLPESTRTVADNSKVTSMNDGHGNVTETRMFPATARLKMIIVRTSTDGSRQVFVYGQDAQVKQLPPEWHDRALTASSDQIADELKMYGGPITKLRQIGQ